MSLAVIPVCACCEKPSGRTISCTSCLRICCTACINEFVDAAVAAGVNLALLPDPICRRCNGSERSINTSEPTIATSTGSAMTEQVLCQLHGQVSRLFCVNCSLEICGACLAPGALHDLHKIDNLVVVYREKIAQVESKLAEVQKVTELLHTEAAAYGRNLELLEKEVAAVVKEIEGAAKRYKGAVYFSTNWKVRTLRNKLKLPADYAAVVADLRNKIEQLPINEFLQQLPDIEQKCDQLIVAKRPIALHEVDYINCSQFISPYCFETIVFRGFIDAGNERVHKSSMKTEYDVEWTLTVRKTHFLRVEASCKPNVNAFRHMIIVVIPHTNYAKEIRETFPLNNNEAIEIVKTSHILEEKYCNDEGDLEIKIGLRPANAVTENLMLKHLWSLNANRYDYNHLTMHFKVKLSEMQIKVNQFSQQIKDEKDRNWCMYAVLNSPNLEAYVQLVDGPLCSSNYFIKLIHNDPEKTIAKYQQEPKYFKTLLHAWGYTFISWEDLINDKGFHPDGVLNFRFGVRPIPDESKAPALCAAKA